MEIITPYIGNDEEDVDVVVNDTTLIESQHQQDAIEKEMQVSQRVHASTLNELNLANKDNESKTMLIAKEMQSAEKTKLVELL